LVILIGNVLYDLLDTASENSAQVVKGRGGDGLVISQLVDGGTGNAVLSDQGIGGFAGFVKRIPEWTI
jgi:hypothetical protein